MTSQCNDQTTEGNHPNNAPQGNRCRVGMGDRGEMSHFAARLPHERRTERTCRRWNMPRRRPSFPSEAVSQRSANRKHDRKTENLTSPPVDVAFGSISTELGSLRHVRFTPDRDGKADIAVGPVRANKRLMHRNKQQNYSTTLSAIARRPAGTVSPSSLAVLRLIDSSNLVGPCTGRLLGDSPFKIRSI
jgi:hypothetical protein